MTPGAHPSARQDDLAVTLARETPYTVTRWQHALNALGPHADELLPTVKDVMAQGGLDPYAASLVVLDAVHERPSQRDGGNRG